MSLVEGSPNFIVLTAMSEEGDTKERKQLKLLAAYDSSLWMHGFDFKNTSNKTFSRIRFYVFLGWASLLIGQQIVASSMEKDSRTLIRTCGSIIVISCSVLKIAFCKVNEKHLKELYRTVRRLSEEALADGDEAYIKILERNERSIQRVYRYLPMSSYFTVATAVVSSALHTMRGRPEFPLGRTWFPFNPYHDLWIFIPVYVYVVFNFFVAAVNVGYSRVIFFNTGLHVGSVMEILAIKLKSLSKLNIENGDLNIGLKKCIDDHIDVIRLAELTNKVFSKSHLLETVTASIQCCILSFVISKNISHGIPTFREVFLLVGSTLSLFIICYIGELLKENSEKIFEATYEVPWHEMRPVDRRTFLFLLRQSRKPLGFHVKGTFHMNMELFLKTMQTTYSLLTILSSMEI